MEVILILKNKRPVEIIFSLDIIDSLILNPVVCRYETVGSKYNVEIIIIQANTQCKC